MCYLQLHTQYCKKRENGYMFVMYHYDGMLLILVTRKGEQRTGKQGTGNGEWESGNQYTAVTHLRIQNGRQK